ncbi:MAG: thioredoxin family protein [Solirubrobacteraceae bacterium]|nr:thioredoxin family protein [Solirubrobacteraceae bacterium]
MSRLALLACLLIAGALLVGCGDSDEDSGSSAAKPAAVPTASPADFPPAAGETLDSLSAELPEGPVFAPSTSVMRLGDNRVGFALFDRARKQVNATKAAVYSARPDGTGVRGPYVAHQESIDVKPQYRSEQAAADLADGDKIWVATVPFSKRGSRILFAVVELDGRMVRTSPFEFKVGTKGGPPDIGEKAIPIHTETAADVGGDYSQLSTRVPPPKDMLQDDFADVVGKKPVVLQFATPALCQTRVCGPVVDIAEQVRAENGDGVVFIQQEIYNDNEVAKGFRPQVAAWRLPTEPWAFVIDRNGQVSDRFEGAFSADELAAAVKKVQ